MGEEPSRSVLGICRVFSTCFYRLHSNRGRQLVFVSMASKANPNPHLRGGRSMRLFAKGPFLLVGLGSSFAYAQTQTATIPTFQHVVVIVQENRTPDNLFQGLCTTPTICSTTPTTSQYNIQRSNWLDNTSNNGGVTQP